jgi:hypothetical protein
MNGRRCLAAFAIAVAPLFVGGCPEETFSGDICEQASHFFDTCGTTVPLLSDGACNGVRMAMARCVVEHAKDCDELATLFARLDACVRDLTDDAGAALPPPEDFPAPSIEGAGGSGGATQASGGAGGRGDGGGTAGAGG